MNSHDICLGRNIENNLHIIPITPSYLELNFIYLELYFIYLELFISLQAIVKACEGLAAKGDIKEKIYGKQKVYVADQSQFPEVDDSEIKSMDGKITQLTEQLKTTMDEVKRLETGTYRSFLILKGYRTVFQHALKSLEITAIVLSLRISKTARKNPKGLISYKEFKF